MRSTRPPPVHALVTLDWHSAGRRDMRSRARLKLADPMQKQLLFHLLLFQRWA